jgi:hypothetical protein
MDCGVAIVVAFPDAAFRRRVGRVRGTLSAGRVELKMPRRSVRASHCHFCQWPELVISRVRWVRGTMMRTLPTRDVERVDVDDRSCGVWTAGAEGAGQVTQTRQATDWPNLGSLAVEHAGLSLRLQLQASYT